MGDLEAEPTAILFRPSRGQQTLLIGGPSIIAVFAALVGITSGSPVIGVLVALALVGVGMWMARSNYAIITGDTLVIVTNGRRRTLSKLAVRSIVRGSAGLQFRDEGGRSLAWSPDVWDLNTERQLGRALGLEVTR